MRWFRMYDEVLNDPKVQQLPAELFRIWVNLLCVSSANHERGTCGTLDEISFHLRLSKPKTKRAIESLIRAGLLEKRGNIIFPHNWDRRQFASDDVAKRVEKHRRNVTRNVTETPEVTPPDTDTDTDTDTTTPDVVVVERARKPDPKPRPHRLPDDWYPGDGEDDWARRAGFDHGFLIAETEKFRDHFRATGKTMTDWSAAWRNWIRRSADFAPKVTPLRANGRGRDVGLTDDELYRIATGGER